MAHILTYPYGVKYSTTLSTYRGQVKDGKNGSLPINDEIHVGDYQQSTGGVDWWGESGFGQDNASTAASGNYAFEQNSDGRGMRFWMETSTNGKQTARWFDFGADGGRQDGDVLNGGARSSWLAEVTGVWFLFNSKDTTETRDCYSRVEHVALRFVDKDRKIRIRKVTEKLGSYTYMNGHRGSSKVIFGYQLDQVTRTEASNNEFRLLGVRVQFQLRRGGNGTHKDTIQAGLDGMRFSLGNGTGSNISTAKHAICGEGNMQWNNFDPDLLKMETR